MDIRIRNRLKLTNLPLSLWNPEILNRLLAPAIIAFVLFFSYYWGSQVSSRLITTLFLAIGSMVMFVVLSGNAKVGLVGILLVSAIGRFSIGTGSKIGLNLTMALSGFMIFMWLLRMVLVEREVRLVPSRVNTPAILFIAATTLSLFSGNVSWILDAPAGASLGAQLGAWSLYVLPMGIMLLVANEVKEQSWIERFTWLFLALGMIYMVSRIVPGLSFLRFKLLAPTFAFGAMFWVWFVALSFGQFLFNKDLKPHWRVATGLCTVTALASSIFQSSGWISGWGLSLLVVGILIWLYSRRLGFLLTLAGAVYLGFAYAGLFSRVLNPVEQYSIFSRFATYPIMFELISANPILGLGPANYYYFTPMYSIFGWSVQFNSHSNYVDILAQTGLVGMGMFLWLAYEIGRLSWGMRKQAQNGFSLGFANAAVAGLLGLLASGFLGDWFLPFIYNIGAGGFRASVYAWFFLGGLMALEQITHNTHGALHGSN